MSSSPEVLKRLRGCRCSGDHRYVHLVSGRPRAAQVYPRAFSERLCEGIAAQKRLHSLGLQCRQLMALDEMTAAVKKLTGKAGPAEELTRRPRWCWHWRQLPPRHW